MLEAQTSKKNGQNKQNLYLTKSRIILYIKCTSECYMFVALHPLCLFGFCCFLVYTYNWWLPKWPWACLWSWAAISLGAVELNDTHVFVTVRGSLTPRRELKFGSTPSFGCHFIHECYTQVYQDLMVLAFHLVQIWNAAKLHPLHYLSDHLVYTNVMEMKMHWCYFPAPWYPFLLDGRPI